MKGITLLYMVLRSIRGRWFRSMLISSCIFILSGFLLVSTIVLKGLEGSLRTGLERLGADIIAVPYAAGEEAQTAVLTGKPVTKGSIPAISVERIREHPAVEKASPFLFLGSVKDTPYCLRGEMFIFAFNPTTDFTILPWLKERLDRPLSSHDAISGSLILPQNRQIILRGYQFNIVGNLEPTGLWLDQSLFIPFNAVKEVKEVLKWESPGDVVTTIAIKLKPGYNLEETAINLILAAPGIWPVRSPKLMMLLKAQRAGLIRSLFLALGIIWVLAVVLTGFVFSLMVGERRREIGLLRAVGAKRRFIFNLFLTESAILGLGGALAGVILGTLFIFVFKSWLITALQIPMLIPTLPRLIAIVAACLALALALSLPALLYPAIRASRLDPALAMREV